MPDGGARLEGGLSVEVVEKQALEMRLRRLEADVDLLVNYVRELAKSRIPAERIRQLEDAYEARF